MKFSFFSGFSEKLIFFGYEDFEDVFGGHHKIRLYLGVISMHFWVFFKVKVQNGGYFGGLLKFQIFLGVLEIPVFFLFLFFFFLGGGGGGVGSER